MQRKFSLRTILSVTTGRLLTVPSGRDNGIGAMYDLLGYMTNDSPFTHQLGRFAEECKPWLYQWFPELKLAENRLDRFDALMSGANVEDAIEKWITDLKAENPSIKDEYEVGQIVGHIERDAISELQEMVPAEKIVPVSV